MASILNTEPELVKAFPFAVKVVTTYPGGSGEHTYVTHFDNMASASFFAYLMGDTETNKVTRYVATDFDQTWREVTYFNV